MSREDVELVHAALLNRGWSEIAPALGLTYRGDRNRQKCPIHNGGSENFTLDVHDGRLAFYCASTCGSGDVLSLIQKLRGCSFPDALREGADLGGVELGRDDDADDVRAERERARSAYLEAHRAKLAEQPKQEKRFAPAEEVTALWEGAGPVTEDREVAGYLASRAIDPPSVASRELLRALRPGQPLPWWAGRRGQDGARRDWRETGHRILIRTWDHMGQLRGVRAWRVGGDEDSPKRLPPAGCISAGLVWANSAAVEMLRHPHPCLVVISEGEPDLCVHAVRGRYAVLGITSGSWTQAFADRIAWGSEVVIRTDLDEAGEKYAKHILETLHGRVAAWRVAA